MGNSLFDQLQKSGLVDKKKVQKAKRDQYQNKKQKSKKGSGPQKDEATLLAEKAQAEKIERDRQLNQQRKEEAERKAITAQIRQMIETNRVTERDGEVAFNFADANVVKRIYVSDEIHTHLSQGRLAIAKLDESYELVPVPVAEKIKQRDETAVIMLASSAESTPDEDDPYADYQIPDDLMW